MKFSAAELEIEFLRASGPGGQHRNRRETGVRIRHLPSGITVVATERRSQAENRKIALLRLEQAIVQRNRQRKRRLATRPGRAARERRLAEKKRRGQLKTLRRRGDHE